MFPNIGQDFRGIDQVVNGDEIEAGGDFAPEHTFCQQQKDLHGK